MEEKFSICVFESFDHKQNRGPQDRGKMLETQESLRKAAYPLSHTTATLRRSVAKGLKGSF